MQLSVAIDAILSTACYRIGTAAGEVVGVPAYPGKFSGEDSYVRRNERHRERRAAR